MAERVLLSWTLVLYCIVLYCIELSCSAGCEMWMEPLGMMMTWQGCTHRALARTNQHTGDWWILVCSAYRFCEDWGLTFVPGRERTTRIRITAARSTRPFLKRLMVNWSMGSQKSKMKRETPELTNKGEARSTVNWNQEPQRQIRIWQSRVSLSSLCKRPQVPFDVFESYLFQCSRTRFIDGGPFQTEIWAV